MIVQIKRWQLVMSFIVMTEVFAECAWFFALLMC